LDYVRYSKAPCLIERHGRPVAALIDYSDYQKAMQGSQHQKWLDQAIDQIKRHYDPEKIVLFGSFASGNAKEGSDIDLFIVKKTNKRRLDRVDEVLDLIDPENPVELHIYTPQEVEKRLKQGDFFIRQVLEKGKLLYEKSG
ncbi:MAG: nucleotidyltransferase domain-containing protein, partial [Deltaproteobacteria bacterium]|nr:nucleotidyltransferase domain-containing protein [Deltaproteobacteria bacterium]